MHRPLAHFRPRYLFDRARWYFYERRYPDRPWINRHAIDLLETMLRGDVDGLEWGSGRSTQWFGKRLRRLTSIENDPAWYETVKRQLAERGVSNVDYLLLKGSQDDPAPDSSEYVRICDRFADASLGFVLIDGWLREQCAKAVVPKVAAGGAIVLDNANWYIDWPTRTPRSRYRRGPANGHWAEFQRMVEGWRFTWTSDGVSDAAIWVKPA